MADYDYKPKMTPTTRAPVKRWDITSDETDVTPAYVLATDYDSLASALDRLEREVGERDERIAELEGQRRLWLDTDNNARVMVTQEKRIEELEAKAAKLDGEANELAQLNNMLLNRITALESDLARARLNAERYEWLRDQGNRKCGAATLLYFTDCDAAIDAAIAARSATHSEGEEGA